MALCKQQIAENGVVTSYHRVSHVFLDGNRLNCTLESYVSHDYREKEQVAERKTYYFEITIEEEESMGIRALCYSKIKTLPEWSDAEDC